MLSLMLIQLSPRKHLFLNILSFFFFMRFPAPPCSYCFPLSLSLKFSICLSLLYVDLLIYIHTFLFPPYLLLWCCDTNVIYSIFMKKLFKERKVKWKKPTNTFQTCLSLTWWDYKDLSFLTFKLSMKWYVWCYLPSHPSMICRITEESLNSLLANTEVAEVQYNLSWPIILC